MRLSAIRSAVAALVLVSSAVVFGEVKTVVDQNTGDKATADFKFTKVPGPSKDKPATKAKVTIIDGDKAENGADADRMIAGTLPTDEDAPGDNFFFADDSEGGRVVFDLGSVMPVTQINTYSWHPNTRGPQVYKLYAADGKADKFDPKPKKGTDPTTCGWKLIATVDTRNKNDPGGQYGVSTTDSDGKLGDYQYVMLDISKTETDDANGNTFYSRVDVVTSK